MRSTQQALVAVTGLIIGTATASSHQHFHSPVEPRQVAPNIQSEDCYSSLGDLSYADTWTWQSTSHCGNLCFGKGKAVFALYNSNQCACGDSLPAASDKIASSQCSQTCPGYLGDFCGGNGAYSIYSTGANADIANANVDSSSSSRSHTSQAATHTSTPAPTTRTTIVANQETIVRTINSPGATGSSSADNSSSSGGHSSGTTIGVAVGVVVGLLVLAALICGGVFYARRRRRMKNAENGHRRADSLNAFVASGATLPGVPPRVFSTSDSRLDPRIMVETRRQSAGSIFADNQDYSRRILKVANPDD